LLAACGGATSQNGAPVPTADVGGITAGSFKATVSGAVSGDFSGTGSSFKQEQGGLLIGLVGTQGPSGASITIIVPVGTAAGTYMPKSYTDAYDSAANKITAIGASFSATNATGGVDAYTTITESTLTL
jgi:hypothetical protein